MKKYKFAASNLLPMFELRSWFTTPSEPLIISGPCSVESEEQLLTTARALASIAEVKVLRGGVWKPRTRPNAFEGLGEDALRWMQSAQAETGLLTATEVATPAHVELALKYGIDILWIGARTVVNPFSMQTLADALRGTDMPVLVKNPVTPDLNLWVGAFERLRMAGLHLLAAVHRGFHYYKETPFRNVPMWEIPIALSRQLNVPVLTDISHICGCRDLLQLTAQKAMDLASDGLMVECHCNPDAALTDACQQITPDALRELLSHVVVRSKETSQTERDLADLRSEIDDIDSELLQLLSRRMSVSEQIGVYKKNNNVAVVQMDRWKKILSEHVATGKELGLDERLVNDVFEAIHKSSIGTQTQVFDK